MLLSTNSSMKETFSKNVTNNSFPLKHHYFRSFIRQVYDVNLLPPSVASINISHMYIILPLLTNLQ